LRVVETLEERYAEFPGLNLTFETREGILKHCSVAKAKELGALGRRFIEHGQPSLEAQLVNLADEIAYNHHDVDDGLRSELLNVEDLRQVALFARHYDDVGQRYPSLPPRRAIYETLRRMINEVITDLIEATQAGLSRSGVNSIDDVRRHPQTLVAFTDRIKKDHLELKQFLRRHLYAHERVRRVTDEAMDVIRDLFAMFRQADRLLPPHFREKAQSQESEPPARARVIADYIAGMTDRYAYREHLRLTSSET
jgi:dGTPase